MKRKLGKRHVVSDSRTVKASKYCKGAKAPPIACDWVFQSDTYPMLANDRIGDCAVASYGHSIICQTATADGYDRAIIPSDEQIISAYSAISGYDPATGANDDGCVMLDCLKYFRKRGVGNVRIGAFAEVDFQNTERLFQAINLFGGVYCGFDLPAKIWELGDDWQCPVLESQRTDDWEPGSAGGHAVFAGGYDAMAGTIDLVSWSEIVTASLAFVAAYMDECYVLIGESWTNDLGQAPSGVDIEQLLHDVSKVSK